MHTIMVVDGEPAISMQLAKRLTSMGYDVIGKASSGEEAIDMATSLRPDLILMDINMTGKFDGIAAAKIIKEKLDTPVIFMGSYPQDRLLDRAKITNPFGYVMKPIQETEIKASIEVALCKKEAEKTLRREHRQLERRVQERTKELAMANKKLQTEIARLKQSEKEARESEKTYQTLLENIKDGIYKIDSKGNIIYVNKVIERRLKIPEHQLIGKSVFDFVDSQYHGAIRNNLAKAIKGKEIQPFELAYTTKEGKKLFLETNIQSFFKDKNTVEVLGISHNITEKKKAYQVLRKSETQKKAILDASIDRIRLVDRDMRTIWANQTHKRDLNIAPLDLIGKTCHEVFIGRKTPCPECPTKKAFKSGNREHTVLIRSLSKNTEEKKYLDTYTVPIKDEFGKIVNCIQLTRDITEQVKAENLLRKNEEKYRTLFETSRDAISITKRDGTYVDFNQSFLDLFGYTEADMIDIRAQEKYLDPNDRKRFQREVEEKGSVKNFEVRMKKKNGDKLHCLMTATLRRAPDGTILGYQNILRDITQRKKMVEALRESETQKKAILDASIDRIRLVDMDLRIIWVNKTTVKNHNVDQKDLIGRICYETYYGRNAPCDECPSKRALKTGKIEHNILYRSKKHEIVKGETYVDSYAVPIKNESGDVVNLIQVSRDITETKMLEKALKRRKKELELKTRNLEEANIALKVLLKRKHEDVKELEEKVLTNMKDMVLPFLEKIRKSRLGSSQLAYLDLVEMNLNHIISPFLRNLSNKYANLTPKEIQIAGLIKEGKSTKEIAELLISSTDAITFHRKNLRMKLGLKNTKTNLRSYLLSF